MTETPLPNPSVKYIVTKRFGVVTLNQGLDNFWRDSEGTVYAYAEAAESYDPVVRCGVGVFSLKVSDPATDACRVHDFFYDSPVYQAFHTREEADLYLESLLEQIPNRSWLAKPFYWLARIFGSPLWERKETNN